MYTKKDFDTIRDIILKAIPQATQIVLFGSYARGSAREDSDIDIVILTGPRIDRQEKLKLLAVLRWDIARKGYNADFILKDEQEFNSDKDLPTLSKVIFYEGKILWKMA